MRTYYVLVQLLRDSETRHRTGPAPRLFVILLEAKTWTCKMSPKNKVRSDPENQNVVPTAVVGVPEPHPWPARILVTECLTLGKFR